MGAWYCEWRRLQAEGHALEDLYETVCCRRIAGGNGVMDRPQAIETASQGATWGQVLKFNFIYSTHSINYIEYSVVLAAHVFE